MPDWQLFAPTLTKLEMLTENLPWSSTDGHIDANSTIFAKFVETASQTASKIQSFKASGKGIHGASIGFTAGAAGTKKNSAYNVDIYSFGNGQQGQISVNKWNKVDVDCHGVQNDRHKLHTNWTLSSLAAKSETNKGNRVSPITTQRIHFVSWGVKNTCAGH